MGLPMHSSTKVRQITPTQITWIHDFFSHPLTLYWEFCAEDITGLDHADFLDYELSLAIWVHRVQIKYLGVFK